MQIYGVTRLTFSKRGETLMGASAPLNETLTVKLIWISDISMRFMLSQSELQTLLTIAHHFAKG